MSFFIIAYRDDASQKHEQKKKSVPFLRLFIINHNLTIEVGQRYEVQVRVNKEKEQAYFNSDTLVHADDDRIA